MSSPKSSLVRTAQATSVFLSIFACGAYFATSFLLVPRLLESPTPLMVRQWLKTYNFAKILYPIVLHPAAAAFYFLSWSYRGANTGFLSRSKLYLTAGLLCQGVGPYTWAVIVPTNRKIIRKAEETRDMAPIQEIDEAAKWLVDHWGMLSLPRGIMMGMSGLLGLLATV